MALSSIGAAVVHQNVYRNNFIIQTATLWGRWRIGTTGLYENSGCQIITMRLKKSKIFSMYTLICNLTDHVRIVGGTGGPDPPGKSRCYRFLRNTGTVSPWARGFNCFWREVITALCEIRWWLKNKTKKSFQDPHLLTQFSEPAHGMYTLICDLTGPYPTYMYLLSYQCVHVIKFTFESTIKYCKSVVLSD